MPSHEFIVSRGRHDLGRAYYLHGRTRLADAAGLELRTRRYTYEECRRFMRVEVKPRVRNSAFAGGARADRGRGWCRRIPPSTTERLASGWIGRIFSGFASSRATPEARIRATPFLEYEDAKRGSRHEGIVRPHREETVKTEVVVVVGRRRRRGRRSDDVERVPAVARKPPSLPRFPEDVYGRRGEWRGWDDFLGRDAAVDETDDTAVRDVRRVNRRANRCGDGDEGRVARATGTRGPRCTRWRGGEAPRTSKQFPAVARSASRDTAQPEGDVPSDGGVGGLGRLLGQGGGGRCWPGGWCRPAATGLGLRLNSLRR